MSEVIRKRHQRLEPQDMPNMMALRFTYRLSLREIGEKFEVHESTVCKAIKRWKGSREARREEG